MNDAQYGQLAEKTLIAIEDAVEDLTTNIDVEASEGVLTLTCEDSDSQVIVSRQMALHQIWVAARSGGYHFAWGDEWRCTTTNESLAELVSRVCSEQSDKPLTIHWPTV